jgi:hypothetical protein
MTCAMIQESGISLSLPFYLCFFYGVSDDSIKYNDNKYYYLRKVET